ncbi:hypothetical protein CANCADRAFT_30637 [Tortispora caseinolytica NRRL Y-17796]|uniref:Tethering factor for nuclear proteasome STS1 n=1 Tax=Tortispora caseinolytica NRRL Y-17796 TaxID=767744 RepID=A0A1E4TL53_9ASCO|nr:hypothetical protein CANCADRAFT_30637 [Tortispora caseinolytica NRRL Y-17796]
MSTAFERYDVLPSADISRKRKIEDDLMSISGGEDDDEQQQQQQQQQQHQQHQQQRMKTLTPKKLKTGFVIDSNTNTPLHKIYQSPTHAITSPKRSSLAMSRYIEGLDLKSLQTLLATVCSQHDISTDDLMKLAARPSPESVGKVLAAKLEAVDQLFPYRCDRRSTYSYGRVCSALKEYYQALSDYVLFFASFSNMTATSYDSILHFLDIATESLHQVPEFDSAEYNEDKLHAYNDLCDAWILTIHEATKRVSGSVALAHDRWQERLEKHNNTSGGRFNRALQTLEAALEWVPPIPDNHFAQFSSRKWI